MNDKIAVITVNFNNYSVTKAFLKNTEEQTDKNFKVFLSDLSTKKEDFKTGNQVEIIKGKNKGYAYGLNIALKKATDQGFNYFITINNDTVVKNDFIKTCRTCFEKNPKSIIGGKIYYAKGYEYHKKYLQEELGKVIWYAGGVIDWQNVYTKHKGVDEVDRGQFNQKQKTDFITGCLMLFDKQVLNSVGYWEEKYFLYYEDADFCVRACHKDVNLIYDPSLTIWHKNAQSTGGSGSKLHQKYQEKNRLRFGLKYAPLKTKLHLLKNLFLAVFKIK